MMLNGLRRLVCWELCWGLYVVGVYLIYLEEENHIGFCCDICSGSVMVRTGNGFEELGFSRLFLGIAIGVASLLFHCI